jgi:hypothetical protein
MDSVQLYLAIGIPIVSNGLMFTVLAVMISSRLTALDSRMSSVESRLTAQNRSLSTRFELARPEERSHRQ